MRSWQTLSAITLLGSFGLALPSTARALSQAECLLREVRTFRLSTENIIHNSLPPVRTSQPSDSVNPNALQPRSEPPLPQGAHIRQVPGQPGSVIDVSGVESAHFEPQFYQAHPSQIIETHAGELIDPFYAGPHARTAHSPPLGVEVHTPAVEEVPLIRQDRFALSDADDATRLAQVHGPSGQALPTTPLTQGTSSSVHLSHSGQSPERLAALRIDLNRATEVEVQGVLAEMRRGVLPTDARHAEDFAAAVARRDRDGMNRILREWREQNAHEVIKLVRVDVGAVRRDPGVPETRDVIGVLSARDQVSRFRNMLAWADRAFANTFVRGQRRPIIRVAHLTSTEAEFAVGTIRQEVVRGNTCLEIQRAIHRLRDSSVADVAGTMSRLEAERILRNTGMSASEMQHQIELVEEVYRRTNVAALRFSNSRQLSFVSNDVNPTVNLPTGLDFLHGNNLKWDPTHRIWVAFDI